MTIENLIKANVETLEGVTLAYQYSDEYDMHLIEVIPSEKMEEDKVYNSVQSIIDEYTTEFPSDIVYIVTPNSRLQMKNISFAYSSQKGYSVHSSGVNIYQQHANNGISKRITLVAETNNSGVWANITPNAMPKEPVSTSFGSPDYAMAA